MKQRQTRWRTLIVVSAISLIVLWLVPFPPPQDGVGLGRVVRALVIGR